MSSSVTLGSRFPTKRVRSASAAAAPIAAAGQLALSGAHARLCAGACGVTSPRQRPRPRPFRWAWPRGTGPDRAGLAAAAAMAEPAEPVFGGGRRGVGRARGRGTGPPVSRAKRRAAAGSVGPVPAAGRWPVPSRPLVLKS